MVRLLKVKELEERKKLVLAKSEMYRQTMKLEVANVRFSAALMKKKLKFARLASGLLGIAAPVAGLLVAQKRAKQSQRGGFVGKLFAGIQLLGQLKPLLGNLTGQRGRFVRMRRRDSTNLSQYL